MTRNLLSTRRHLITLNDFTNGAGLKSDLQSLYPLSGDTAWGDGRYLIHPNGAYRVTQDIANTMGGRDGCFMMHAEGDENPTVSLTLVGDEVPKPNLY